MSALVSWYFLLRLELVGTVKPVASTCMDVPSHLCSLFGLQAPLDTTNSDKDTSWECDGTCVVPYVDTH